MTAARPPFARACWRCFTASRDLASSAYRHGWCVATRYPHRACCCRNHAAHGKTPLVIAHVRPLRAEAGRPASPSSDTPRGESIARWACRQRSLQWERAVADPRATGAMVRWTPTVVRRRGALVAAVCDVVVCATAAIIGWPATRNRSADSCAVTHGSCCRRAVARTVNAQRPRLRYSSGFRQGPSARESSANGLCSCGRCLPALCTAGARNRCTRSPASAACVGSVDRRFFSMLPGGIAVVRTRSPTNSMCRRLSFRQPLPYVTVRTVKCANWSKRTPSGGVDRSCGGVLVALAASGLGRADPRWSGNRRHRGPSAVAAHAAPSGSCLAAKLTPASFAQR